MWSEDSRSFSEGILDDTNMFRNRRLSNVFGRSSFFTFILCLVGFGQCVDDNERSVSWKNFWITTGSLMIIIVVLMGVIIFLLGYLFGRRKRRKQSDDPLEEVSAESPSSVHDEPATILTSLKEEEGDVNELNYCDINTHRVVTIKEPHRSIKSLPGVQTHRPRDVPLRGIAKRSMSSPPVVGYCNDSFTDDNSNGSNYEDTLPSLRLPRGPYKISNRTSLDLYQNTHEEEFYEVTI